jgi:HEPN domain-containing protein
MSEHRAWLRQAQKDRESAERVLDLADGSSFCHFLAKSQQAVEKSVKALVAALRDLRGIGVDIGWTHSVERFMSVLTKLPRSQGANQDIQSNIRALFHETTRGNIRALDGLAPRRPPPGEPPGRNTEYPFQNHGVWQAPSDTGIFSRDDVSRFRSLASRVVEGCARVISAIERGPS